MDMCKPPDLDMVAQAVLLWAGSCRQQLLHAGATVQSTSVQYFAPRRWVKSLDHIHICVLGCAFHIRWCLAWLGSASVATTRGWNLAGIKEWFGLRVAASERCAALGMHDPPVDDGAHLLFSCPATAVVKQERRFAQLPFTSLQDLCCRDVYGVALFVRKCMTIADAAAVAAARQQPR
jgi:hypothetical protein